MGSTKEIQTRMKSIQDTMKISHVYDFFIQDAEGQENPVRYRAVLL